MPIRVHCPSCDDRFVTSRRYRGKKVRCPVCRDWIKIRASSKGEGAEADDPADDGAPDAVERAAEAIDAGSLLAALGGGIEPDVVPARAPTPRVDADPPEPRFGTPSEAAARRHEIELPSEDFSAGDADSEAMLHQPDEDLLSLLGEGSSSESEAHSAGPPLSLSGLDGTPLGSGLSPSGGTGDGPLDLAASGSYGDSGDTAGEEQVLLDETPANPVARLDARSLADAKEKGGKTKPKLAPDRPPSGGATKRPTKPRRKGSAKASGKASEPPAAAAHPADAAPRAAAPAPTKGAAPGAANDSSDVLEAGFEDDPSLNSDIGLLAMDLEQAGSNDTEDPGVVQLDEPVNGAPGASIDVLGYLAETGGPDRNRVGATYQPRVEATAQSLSGAHPARVGTGSDASLTSPKQPPARLSGDSDREDATRGIAPAAIGRMVLGALALAAVVGLAANRLGEFVFGGGTTAPLAFVPPPADAGGAPRAAADGKSGKGAATPGEQVVIELAAISDVRGWFTNERTLFLRVRNAGKKPLDSVVLKTAIVSGIFDSTPLVETEIECKFDGGLPVGESKDLTISPPPDNPLGATELPPSVRLQATVVKSNWL